ncbi:6096_t:CDS:2 [Funneliformis mosseae]|uniref:6096_t:CDS:1 n=1 Tax=Funneliformis mosseae TaxID=27381 RepID=A0A9N8YNU8_FUNMO|nr:6096_t:CDS:2 [Funneliformis mosseae]
MGACASKAVKCNEKWIDEIPFDESTTPYRYINGRRFHMDETIKYIFPNDEEGIEKLELQYYLLKEYWRTCYTSPITPILSAGGGRVLDIGCGTGSWIMDLAAEYKATIFIGLDISPVFPQHVKPRNASFVQYNILNELPFPDDTFDYVHQSLLSTSFTASQWQDVLLEIVRVTKPGGWIEFLEYDYVLHNEGPIIKRLNAGITSFFLSQGLIPNISKHLPELMRSNDQLMDVRCEKRSVPLGGWGGSLGSVSLEVFVIELSALRDNLQPVMGLNDQHYDALIEGFVSEANKYKSYINTFRFYVQKVM